MLVAFTAIAGFLSSVAPLALTYLTQKDNNAQQVRLKELDFQMAEKGYKSQLDIANIQADAKQSESLYAYDASASGIKWVDAMRGLVRPYITLVLFHMWMAIELTVLYYGIQRDIGVKAIIDATWSQETAALFAAVISFWFGQRAVNYAQANMNASRSMTRSFK